MHPDADVDRGFSLVEALLAVTVTTLAVSALVQLAILSARANDLAESTTFAAVLASQKLEQLRALTWTFDQDGAPISDTSTDTTMAPERLSGGTGLAPSPTNALLRSTPGYCDFLDASGLSLGGSTTPPARAAFVRRWSIGLVGAATDTLVIQVSVMRVRGQNRVGDTIARRLPGEVRMTGIKTRKGTR